MRMAEAKGRSGSCSDWQGRCTGHIRQKKQGASQFSLAIWQYRSHPTCSEKKQLGRFQRADYSLWIASWPTFTLNPSVLTFPAGLIAQALIEELSCGL
jgi:hypothetical protein